MVGLQNIEAKPAPRRVKQLTPQKKPGNLSGKNNNRKKSETSPQPEAALMNATDFQAASAPMGVNQFNALSGPLSVDEFQEETSPLNVDEFSQATSVLGVEDFKPAPSLTKTGKEAVKTDAAPSEEGSENKAALPKPKTTKIEPSETEKKEEGKEDGRLIFMVQPELDGGPEKMEQKNEEQKGQVSASLDAGSTDAVAKSMDGIKTLGTNEQTTKSPAKKIKEAESAVQISKEEKQSEANTAVVSSLNETAPPEPKGEEVAKGLGADIQRIVPEKLEDVDNFAKEGKTQEVSMKVAGQVKKESGKVQETYQQIDNAPDPEAPPTPAAIPGMEAPVETPKLDLGKGLVPEVEAEQTDLTEFANESDNLMKKEGITDEQLDMVDSGDLAKAREERGGLKEQVKSAPQAAKKFEQEERQKVETDLEKEEKTEKESMRQERKRALGESGKKQSKAKIELEKKRQKVTNDINQIYKMANLKVQMKLAKLETESIKLFDAYVVLATFNFEKNVDRDMKAFKRERYSGLGGKFTWAADLFRDVSEFPKVKAIFDNNRARFISDIDKAIAMIMERSKRVIEECKQIIADAKVKIQEYVDGLEPSLAKIGKQAQGDVSKKLDALTEKVNKASAKLKEKLDAKRKKAIEAIDKRIEEMKAAMASILSIIGNFLLNAMLKFFKWALEKAGFSADQFMGIINKGKEAITAIVTDPLGFMGNLLDAVGLGINNFGKNIKTHLLNGLVEWLTGAVGGMIKIPEKFDLKGVFGMALDIMGLSWGYLRGKIVKRLGPNGERIMRVAETTYEVVVRVIDEGPIGLWNWIKEQAAMLKTAVIEGIRDWAIKQIVKTAMIKLLSMLNPAGAIVQAILLIYDVVMFFVNNIQRIMAMVESVINSVANIAAGAIGDAANYIEAAMARTIPMILSFLARLLKLDGIGKEIQKIIKNLRKRVDGAIDKGLDWLIGKIKGWFGGKGGNNGDKDGKHKDEKMHQKYVQEIKEEMIADPKGETISEIHSRKETQARKLEQKYNAKIDDGVKTTIDLEPVDKAKEDGAIDFEVRIAPNDSEAEGVIRPESDGSLRIAEKVIVFNRKGPTIVEKDYVDQIRWQQEGLNDLTVVEFLRNKFRFEGLEHAMYNPRDADGNLADSGRTKASKTDQAKLRRYILRDLEEGYSSRKRAELADQGIEVDEERLQQDAENYANEILTSDHAILHNPDQTAGGHDVVSDEYVRGSIHDEASFEASRFVGAKNANSSLGSQWDKKIRKKDQEEFVRLYGPVPLEKRSIQLMNHVRDEAEKLTTPQKSEYKLDVKLEIFGSSS